MKKLLVTGGAGFVGSNFIRYILHKYTDYSVVNLDALTYAGHLENLEDLDQEGRYIFAQGDIRNRELVNRLFQEHGFDTVVHFAAESHVDRSILEPDLFISTNVLGTQVLLDEAKKAWQIGKESTGYPIYREGVKYVQISTDEVYGSLGTEGLFTEETPIAPTSPYSASKASADLMVYAYFHTFHLPINITRCSNNYGPYQYTEKLIPLMIVKALAGQKLPVYGDGLQVRDWIYVLDHCKGIDTVLHNGRSGEIYNLGGNNEKTNIEIVRLILKELSVSEDQIDTVEDRLGHDRRYAIDYSKVHEELSWEPEANFEQSLRKTIQWYRDQYRINIRINEF